MLQLFLSYSPFQKSCYFIFISQLWNRKELCSHRKAIRVQLKLMLSTDHSGNQGTAQRVGQIEWALASLCYENLCHLLHSKTTQVLSHEYWQLHDETMIQNLFSLSFFKFSSNMHVIHLQSLWSAFFTRSLFLYRPQKWQ